MPEFCAVTLNYMANSLLSMLNFSYVLKGFKACLVVPGFCYKQTGDLKWNVLLKASTITN